MKKAIKKNLNTHLVYISVIFSKFGVHFQFVLN